MVTANQLNLITGINCKEFPNSPGIAYGNPNDSSSERLNTEGTIGASHSYAFYPNPVNDMLTVNSDENIKYIWTVPGKKNTQYRKFDFETYYNETSLDTSGIYPHLSYEHFNQSNSTSQLMLNFANKTAGFYKVVIETDSGELMWFTIYKVQNPDDESYKIW